MGHIVCNDHVHAQRTSEVLYHVTNACFGPYFLILCSYHHVPPQQNSQIHSSAPHSIPSFVHQQPTTDGSPLHLKNKLSVSWKGYEEEVKVASIFY